MGKGWPKESIRAALREAAEEIGHSPSLAEYDELYGRGPAGRTIRNKYGTWNAAKRDAGLETHPPHGSYPNWRLVAEIEERETADQEVPDAE